MCQKSESKSSFFFSYSPYGPYQQCLCTAALEEWC
jgi:hypothetical protein